MKYVVWKNARKMHANFGEDGAPLTHVECGC